jgi:hypothetical protein
MTPGPRSETETRPVASIVVPTRDRPEGLSRCLDALDAQTLNAAVEIVVVDDGSCRLGSSASPTTTASLLRTGPRASSMRSGQVRAREALCDARASS